METITFLISCLDFMKGIKVLDEELHLYFLCSAGNRTISRKEIKGDLAKTIAAVIATIIRLI